MDIESDMEIVAPIIEAIRGTSPERPMSENKEGNKTMELGTVAVYKAKDYSSEQRRSRERFMHNMRYGDPKPWVRFVIIPIRYFMNLNEDTKEKLCVAMSIIMSIALACAVAGVLMNV